MADDIFRVLQKVRQESPVVHHLTNWVTIYDCAQVVKTLGGSPVMAHAPEEVAEMAAIAGALVLNIGTLTAGMVAAMKLAAAAANERGIPVVLDVCGAGATTFRDRACRELLSEVRINIIKGNASEIARVSGLEVKTRGVDATRVDGDLTAVARQLARDRRCAVALTGATDLVADSNRLFQIGNGHSLMGQVVGTGCMAASVIGACAAVEPDLAWAAAAALTCFGIAGELAADAAAGPGSFKEKLFDSLFNLDLETVERRQKVVTL